jgi:hypothetical protein
MIQIQPLSIPTQGTAVAMILKCQVLDMTATTADFYFELISAGTYNSPHKVLASGSISMTEAEYDQWGADNTYCIQWAAQKLGLTLI